MATKETEIAREFVGSSARWQKVYSMLTKTVSNTQICANPALLASRLTAATLLEWKTCAAFAALSVLTVSFRQA